MIDGRCKRREALSRAALIGRALDFPFHQAPLGGRPGRGPAAWGRTSSESCCAAPRARWGALGVNAPRGPAAMAGGERPEPSRTRKLSPRAPMVLRSSPWESGSPPSRERHSEGVRPLGRAPSARIRGTTGRASPAGARGLPRIGGRPVRAELVQLSWASFPQPHKVWYVDLRRMVEYPRLSFPALILG